MPRKKKETVQPQETVLPKETVTLNDGKVIPIDQIPLAVKPVYRNNIMQNRGVVMDEGVNKLYLTLSIALYKMDKVDMFDSKAVDARIEEYFQLFADADVKPTVMGLAMALGIDRQTLRDIYTGRLRSPNCFVARLPRETSDAIKKAYSVLNNLWENHMQNGQLNPVTGIFLGTNNFGYLNKAEYTLAPGGDEQQTYDEKAIRERYGLPSDSDTTSDG